MEKLFRESSIPRNEEIDDHQLDNIVELSYSNFCIDDNKLILNRHGVVLVLFHDGVHKVDQFEKLNIIGLTQATCLISKGCGRKFGDIVRYVPKFSMFIDGKQHTVYKGRHDLLEKWCKETLHKVFDGKYEPYVKKCKEMGIEYTLPTREELKRIELLWKYRTDGEKYSKAGNNVGKLYDGTYDHKIDDITDKPQFKLIMTGFSYPLDTTTWRRLRVIPFDTNFNEPE